MAIPVTSPIAATYPEKEEGASMTKLSALVKPPQGPLKITSHTSDLSFSLVIPTYNESKNVGKLVSHLCALLDNLLPQQYELILVDDNSPDLTWEVAQELTVHYPRLRVMRRQVERGAILSGHSGLAGG